MDVVIGYDSMTALADGMITGATRAIDLHDPSAGTSMEATMSGFRMTGREVMSKLREMGFKARFARSMGNAAKFVFVDAEDRIRKVLLSAPNADQSAAYRGCDLIEVTR